MEPLELLLWLPRAKAGAAPAQALPPAPPWKPPEGFLGWFGPFRRSPEPQQVAGWAAGLCPEPWPRGKLDNGEGGCEGNKLNPLCCPGVVRVNVMINALIYEDEMLY